MVDVQRAAIMRSLTAGAVASTSSTSSGTSLSPHMYQLKTENTASQQGGMNGENDQFYNPISQSPATSTASSMSSRSPYSFAQPSSVSESSIPVQPEEEDNLFAAYAADPQPQELDDPLQVDEWDYYYPPATANSTDIPPELISST